MHFCALFFSHLYLPVGHSGPFFLKALAQFFIRLNAWINVMLFDQYIPI